MVKNDEKLDGEWFFQALDMETTQLNQKTDKWLGLNKLYFIYM